MVFCNTVSKKNINIYNLVTILILIDGFLQYIMVQVIKVKGESHNPYFNRWFSAIGNDESSIIVIMFVTILILIDGFLQ